MRSPVSAQHRAASLLARLGCRTVALDRTDGAHPFAVGGQYAQHCPVCGRFATVFVDARGVWSLCGDLGTPQRPLDELDLVMRLRAA